MQNTMDFFSIMANGSDFLPLNPDPILAKNGSGSDVEKYRPCGNDSLKFKRL